MRKKYLIIIMFLIVAMAFLLGCQNKSFNEDKALEENFTPQTSTRFSSNDLIYFILTDRFYDGDPSNNEGIDRNDLRAYHGGDLKGITKKLDYIKSLGATAIWMTPVAKNEFGGYHGYWINDFYRVDPRLGTMDDLRQLVREAHKRDIKIILDFVVNHTGYKSPWLTDEKYRDWFNPNRSIANWNDQEQVERGWLMGLPDLNQDNPEVRSFLIENALWWIRETGIDGMRLDTVKHVPKDFWVDFIEAIKREYPDFFLLGEVWHDNPRYLQSYIEIGFDGLTNFPLHYGIQGTFTRYGRTAPLINAIRQQEVFTNPHLNGIFIDNHDTRRFVTAAGEFGEEYLKQALTFIMTYPAIPVIYYGTEIGMEGENDPYNRRFMEWERLEDSEILQFYRKLVELRRKNSIREGTFELLDYDMYFLSYKREIEDEAIIVVMNIQNREKTVEVNIEGSNYSVFYNYFTGEEVMVENGVLKLELTPISLIILTTSK